MPLFSVHCDIILDNELNYLWSFFGVFLMGVLICAVGFVFFKLKRNKIFFCVAINIFKNAIFTRRFSGDVMLSKIKVRRELIHLHIVDILFFQLVYTGGSYFLKIMEKKI